ncbi:hypothetical protein HDIA_0634 [Hartmannibacter diazotrophicus]|uniref:SHOCT domain-containing protein n=1 Tax=Hartmannibacter diazotrophicus TaxID=1482074 RepID=A0A2C9D3Y2_9HYPH|nr:SHOCT domain-containing protein [Hartmannibacter diazotrophicus]SON54175.1 hypothetical protein HDIA_0634 [Hartmannibacter diazotrophicus]
MDQLSDEGRRVLGDIAARHGVSLDAVEHLLFAVMAGQGTQAQFNHPDLGGMGQWSQGGMIMVGDMFNNALKARVDALCTELAGVARTAGILMPARSSQSQSQGGGYPSGFQGQSQGSGHSFDRAMGQGMTQSGGGVSLFVPGFRPGGAWWPEDLGQPSSTGGQNDLRYAFFPQSRRLAIDIGGRTTVYDTRDHQISGFSQQQSGDQSVTFTSQYGLVRVADLDIVPLSGAGGAEPETASPPHAPATVAEHEDEAGSSAVPPAAAANVFPSASPIPTPPTASTDEDIFGKIERLAGLHAKGILTDDEFQTKKAELLARL